ncbi:MAG: DUF4190 domain-containing protein [Verrucomicrobiae bacterium]
MYKIIGNDGKTYGPVTAAQVREWIAQGRVENRTAVLGDGAMEWTFLGLLPEFAPHFSGPPPVMAPPKIGALPTRGTNGFATAGLICGIISCACCCGCPFNILGLIFSIIALVQINAQVQKQDGWGLALAGLICSAASLLFTFGCGIFQLVNTPANFAWHFGAI